MYITFTASAMWLFTSLLCDSVGMSLYKIVACSLSQKRNVCVHFSTFSYLCAESGLHKHHPIVFAGQRHWRVLYIYWYDRNILVVSHSVYLSLLTGSSLFTYWKTFIKNSCASSYLPGAHIGRIAIRWKRLTTLDCHHQVVGACLHFRLL